MKVMISIYPEELSFPENIEENVRAAAEKVGELYGVENFSDMIADETVTEDMEELYAFLTEKGHPVLGMEPLM